MSPRTPWRQTWALCRKNLTITLTRCWLSTLIRAYVLPLLFAVLLLEIPNLASDGNRYGVGAPAKVATLADSMKGSSKLLAIIESRDLGPDFPAALARLTDPLDKTRVLRLDSESQVPGACAVDFHGKSNCHAVLIFHDSPGSGRVDATWNYTIRTDPTRTSASRFNPIEHSGDVEGFFLPLQMSIDNALADSSDVPEAFSFTPMDQATHDREARDQYLSMATYILSFVFFASMMMVCHHVSSMITSERESGLSELIDAMSGGAAWPRVASYIIVFDLLYLPLWIILGCIFSTLLFTSSSPAIPIFWQVLTGWAVTHSSVFAAAFFRRSGLGAIAVTGMAFLLSVLAAYVENDSMNPPSISLVAPLGLLFPSMNYVFFFDVMAQYEAHHSPVSLDRAPPVDNMISGWVGQTAPSFLWVELAVQILAFPLLALVVERGLYANNRKGRAFHARPESSAAIETTQLEKHYLPSVWKRMFCCSRNKAVKAVDGLDLTSQKNQILCLLGPNGSGKSTTLDMIAGFQAPTQGSIAINAAPSDMGICPQKNVLWDNLTVSEHVVLWNQIKGNVDSNAALEALLETCDLTLKKRCLSKNLSGGMKRKLQLACALVGGSSVCLMDEVSSGLDPISRRVIWNAILQERSRRTMVFTTHFLDECEVLSDHVVILSLGKLNCQGTPAELKTQYGDGYRVSIPKSQDVSQVAYPVFDEGSHYVCVTPDSASAARLLSQFRGLDDSELFITGPTIEDVFLKLSKQPSVSESECPEDGSTIDDPAPKNAVEENQATPTRWAIFFRQVRALLIKRILVLRTQWWIYVAALAIPIIASNYLGTFIEDYKPPVCSNLIGDEYGSASPLWFTSPENLVAGPPSANSSIVQAAQFGLDTYYNESGYTRYDDGRDDPTPRLKASRDEFLASFATGSLQGYDGGIFLGKDASPLIAFPAMFGLNQALSLMNVANGARTGARIAMSYGSLRSYSSASLGSSIVWTIIFCLLQALYPAFFALYPTFERRSKVRALQYSNGVRPVPLWLSHLAFDAIFIVIISVVCTVLIAPQAPFWGLGYLWLVLVMYGLAAALQAYLISTFTTSQPAAVAIGILVMTIEFILAVVATTMTNTDQSAADGVTFGLGLIFPIENLMRAVSVSLNQYIVRCRGTETVSYPGSIYAYGGPILLLLIQMAGLFVLLLWLDGTAMSFRKPKTLQQDEEKDGLSGRPDVDAEAARVAKMRDDLLQLDHVSKTFASATAVDKVTLGLQKGEILALLGPNGAGKSTCINMIRSELAPSRGHVYLAGTDVREKPRLAQKLIGVCPQFDALDKLTVREHLAFYARCKGVGSVRADVEHVMARVGLRPHAGKMAAKLSGGNKRKLSLAIALLGNPPVLLLDEPSSAMDAASKRVLWKTLEAVAADRSVLITTHSMEEADALATRAAIISKRLLAIGTTQELRRHHSNEYHVHLVLKSAPVSAAGEMQSVADWVLRVFPNARFEGKNLGGQVRFIVPADSPTGGGDAHAGSYAQHLIETLEQHKEDLALQCYSIGAATMERVFLSVVKESDAVEEEERNRRWHWRA